MSANTGGEVRLSPARVQVTRQARELTTADLNGAPESDDDTFGDLSSESGEEELLGDDASVRTVADPSPVSSSSHIRGLGPVR